MARMDCRCGYSMWNGQTPNDIEFTVFSDARSCELLDNPPALFAEPAEGAFAFMNFLDMADYEAWRCPRCGRLYIFDRQRDSDHVQFVYRLEEDV